MLLIQADGASKGNPGPASYGVAIYWSDGTLASEIYEAIGIATNNQAEYRAVLAGLEAASKLLAETPDPKVLHIQMDSKLVIEQLSGRWKIKNSELQQLAIQAQRLLQNFEVKLEWIPRELNSTADALANRALSDTAKPAEAPSQISLIQPRSVRAPRQSIEPTVIWAIRHGHTKLTEIGLISGGGTDPALSEFGQLEAERVATEIERLAKLFDLPLPEHLWHSPQKRAEQTSARISGDLAIPKRVVSDLREIEFGEWEGASMEALSGISITEIEQWRGSLEHRPPQGESVRDLERRVRITLDQILATENSSVAVVAHMMPLRAIYRLATGAAESAHWGVSFVPASVSVYRFFGINYAEVFAVNSTAHLEALQKRS